MSQCTVTLNDANELAICGHLRLEDVETLIQQCRALIHDSAALIINLKAVLSSDSSGLALLLNLIRFGKDFNRNITIKDCPESLIAIAEVTGLKNVLPFQP